MNLGTPALFVGIADHLEARAAGHALAESIDVVIQSCVQGRIGDDDLIGFGEEDVLVGPEQERVEGRHRPVQPGMVEALVPVHPQQEPERQKDRLVLDNRKRGRMRAAGWQRQLPCRKKR